MSLSTSAERYWDRLPSMRIIRVSASSWDSVATVDKGTRVPSAKTTFVFSTAAGDSFCSLG